MRRNTVLYRMVSVNYLDREHYEAIRDSSTITNIRTADVKESFAPHYAEQVRQWLNEWGRRKWQRYICRWLQDRNCTRLKNAIYGPGGCQNHNGLPAGRG